MKILGVNLSHDSGAAVVRDGVIVAAANEERFDRLKSSTAIPLRSIEVVLQLAGCEAKDIDVVAVAGLSHRGAPPVTNDFRRKSGSNADVLFTEILDRLRITPFLLGTAAGMRVVNWLRQKLPHIGVGEFLAQLRSNGLRAAIPIRFVDHHVAHLASAYFTSGFDRCLVISNDGFGDGFCFRAAVYDGGQASFIAALPMFHSLGNYYNYATELCGFPKYYHGGKTTGLAAFGNAERTGPIFFAELDLHPRTGLYRNRGRLFKNEIDRLRTLLAGASREDIAAGVQQLVEHRGVAVVRTLLQRTGQSRLALAGGVHANVKLNQRLANLDQVEAVFIHPHMGDGGIAAGAAFHVWASMRPPHEAPSYRLPHAYLGPPIEDADADAALQAASLSGERLDEPSMLEAVARLLAEKRIVALARGPMEYGPRALGNRSILLHATDPAANDWLNKQLRRTEFMPFAPIVRAVDAASFFVDYGANSAHTAEFMTITYDCTPRCRRESPAIVHVDGTARPQVVRREVNPFLYDLLGRYQATTGLSLLINTSFNMHEEPIVASAADAVRAFLASGIDALVLGNRLVMHPSHQSERPELSASSSQSR